MSKEIAIVFTSKSIDTILAEGGTAAWRLDRNNARLCKYAICTRNALGENVEGKEAHKSAFLIGRISDVAPAKNEEGRFIIRFSHYAHVNLADFWKGIRNPILYSEIRDLTIDFDKLKWVPMPEVVPAQNVPTPPKSTSPQTIHHELRALTMAEAKQGLALTFGVTPEAIEITVRG
jgi:hypothetical protein